MFKSGNLLRELTVPRRFAVPLPFWGRKFVNRFHFLCKIIFVDLLSP
jgi:hypothetical protein